MFRKQRKHYADWRDANGTRKRKSFASPRAALKFEQEQKALAHPKHRGKGRPSPLPFSRKRQADTNQQSARHPSSSSQRQAHSGRTKSPLQLCRKPTTR
jgi:hypothetical protein